MAVFRVERNKGYTVMSNHHLRNKELSLKAKGLLSQMLSLPEDWDYTLKGLSLINREKIDAIREAIRELERAGYIVRSRERDEKGRLRGADYVIFEQPQPPTPDLPIGAHDDRLPPEVIEEARAAAHEAGLPFSEKPYRDGADFNPYVFDGSMSIEDFELMHRMIEKERSEQMAEPILSGYLSNLGKYTEGRPAGEWVTFPTTAEHLKEVFDRIGIDFKHYEEWHFTEFQSTIPGLTEHLSEYSHPDELNYLGKLLEMQFDDDREKFIAAIEYGDHADSLTGTVSYWTTGTSAYVRSLFPIRFSASGSGLRCFPPTSCSMRSFTRPGTGRSVPSAARSLRQAPTASNTAPTAGSVSPADKPPSA